MIDSLESFKDRMDQLAKSQLALYGQIDAAVVEARESPSPTGRKVIDTVERLLPNTTGPGQAGWYAELGQFFATKCRSTPAAKPDAVRHETRSAAPQMPDYTESVSWIGALPADEFDSLRGDTRSDDLGVPPPDPVATALSYPALVLAKIDAARTGSDQINPGSSPLSQPIAAVRELSPRVAMIPADRINGITKRRDFQTIVGRDDPTGFAARAQPCFGTLEQVDGQYCSSIYTDFTEVDLTVADIRRVLNPCNWPDCCSFFRAVKPQTPEYQPDHWNRILETIGPEPDEFLINTALLFYYGEVDDGIYLNYDVDPSKQNDSGLVEVDSGYIYVTPTAGGGVRIRTSKQERVNGLSPTATSALACFFGWGQIGRFMLAGTAQGVKNGTINLTNPTDFVCSADAYKAYQAKLAANKADQPPKPASAPATIRGHLPPNFADTVGDVTDLSIRLVDAVAGTWGRAASRWLDGLTDTDVTAITTDLGEQLTKYAGEVYAVAAANVKPEQTRPNDGQAGPDQEGGSDD